MSQSDNKQERPADKRDGKFVKKSYPRPWEVELTDEEIEVLRKSLKEDEMRYEAKVNDWQRISHFQSY
ncbi:hypothetical protein N3Z17_05270 [Candidatus Bandiella numerosa]|jgi:hypothetical protein|uniref:hypothetical protein n=1 Tax=Candidatus Bandiella numerosa TaxID=2570586 RepID=UPI00249E62D4|nr:hypothetical protein [Candidatus Bandiella numerosa]WHA04633.1 hypothetical protein N3Z17_05270 [Candidatus Bandiella numerosa]